MTGPTDAMRVPRDYYERIHEVEERHPWHRGMRAISVALLGDRLLRSRRLLDAGCGTGGFLRFVLDAGRFDTACGTDVSAEAIELASRRVPEASFTVAPLRSLPFPDGFFDLVVCNDVLQHVPESHVGESLAELRRVMSVDATLLLRTNGALRGRRECHDWRVYDGAGLAALLERSGLRCERVTYANLAGSACALARGRRPRAPSEHRHGIPSATSGRAGALPLALLRAEARYLAGGHRRLPYGHTLLTVASP